MERILEKGINHPPLPSDYPEYIARVERHLDQMFNRINILMRNVEYSTRKMESVAQLLDASVCNAKIEFSTSEQLYYKQKNIIDSIFYAIDILGKRTNYLEDLMRAHMEDAPESKIRVQWAEEKLKETL